MNGWFKKKIHELFNVCFWKSCGCFNADDRPMSTGCPPTYLDSHIQMYLSWRSTRKKYHFISEPLPLAVGTIGFHDHSLAVMCVLALVCKPT